MLCLLCLFGYSPRGQGFLQGVRLGNLSLLLCLFGCFGCGCLLVYLLIRSRYGLVGSSDGFLCGLLGCFLRICGILQRVNFFCLCIFCGLLGLECIPGLPSGLLLSCFPSSVRFRDGLLLVGLGFLLGRLGVLNGFLLVGCSLLSFCLCRCSLVRLCSHTLLCLLSRSLCGLRHLLSFLCCFLSRTLSFLDRVLGLCLSFYHLLRGFPYLVLRCSELLLSMLLEFFRLLLHELLLFVADLEVLRELLDVLVSALQAC
mmetsp:Transcript_89767/g.214585  ORF Transcript_89767/g.214585 Transcript_89767/m.214585 type:complete len:257 (+) Transcript_89767:287-1057(+)